VSAGVGHDSFVEYFCLACRLDLGPVLFRMNLEADPATAVLRELIDFERMQSGRPRARVDLSLDATQPQIRERHPLAPAYKNSVVAIAFFYIQKNTVSRYTESRYECREFSFVDVTVPDFDQLEFSALLPKRL